MKICIIGTGAAGWIACSLIKKLDFVKEITIIGSSKIPSIGVGESTTLSFVENFLDETNFLKDFVCKSDASVKYGVYYKNWAERDFIHHFKSNDCFARNNTTQEFWGQSLANKDFDVHIHDLIGNKLWNFIHKNEVSTNLKEHLHSWHFDAGKFANFLKNKNINDVKVNFIEDTIVECKYSDKKIISYVIGESNKKYKADYFVNCCGDNELNENVFDEEYFSYSNYLLTNKALVYPLEYKCKKEEFHPYTVAKTMKCGWRWITPTQSRIGTGYVFSDNHISVDEATNEFLEDIGDKSILPRLVDFVPRMNKNPFKVEDMNRRTLQNYNWWTSFILHQYKSCHRYDSDFWKDQKNIEFDFYSELLGCFEYIPPHLFERFEFMMLFHTTAAKDFKWNSMIPNKPFPIEDIDTETIHHLDYIQRFYN